MLMMRRTRLVATAAKGMTRQFHTTSTPFQQLNELPLEWKQSIVPNGNSQSQIFDTVLYKHPTYEQVLQVKQARYSVALKIQKRSAELLKEKEFVLKSVSDQFERKQIEDQYAEKIAEMKRGATPDKTLSADEIREARELYAQDPFTNTTQNLAKRYGVKPFYVVQVVDNLILESKTIVEKKKLELKELRVRNQNKPKKSLRKVHQVK